MPFHNLKYVVKEPKNILKIWKIMWPALLQSLTVTFASVIDVVLIGSILPGRDSIIKDMVNGAEAATLLVSLISFAISAFSLAGNIYYGQFLRTQEKAKIQEITHYKILAAIAIVLFFVTIFVAVGFKNLIGLILTGPTKTAIPWGTYYMKWLLLPLIPTILTLPFYGSLIAEGKAIVTMIISFIGIVFNIIFVIILVNSHLGHMGLKGVAIGTFLAKCIELALVINYINAYKPIWSPSWKIWKISQWTFKKLTWASFGILPSELMYPVFAILSSKILIWTVPPDQIKTYLNVSFATKVWGQIAFSITLCFSSAVPVFISSHLGNNNFITAEENSKRLIASSFLLILITTGFIMLGALWFPYVFFKHVFDSKFLIFIGQISILGTSIGFMLYAFTVQLFVIVRSGGFQLLISFCDQGFWFIIYLPLKYMGLKLFYPVIPIYWVNFVNDFYIIMTLSVAISFYYLLPWKKNLIKNISSKKNLTLTPDHLILTKTTEKKLPLPSKK